MRRRHRPVTTFLPVEPAAMLRSSLFLGLCALATLVSSVLGWTVTVSGNDYIVDTSGGLTFTGKIAASCSHRSQYSLHRHF